MKKRATKSLPPVIPAPPELLAKMQRLFARPPVSFEVAKAQTDLVLSFEYGLAERFTLTGALPYSRSKKGVGSDGSPAPGNYG